jgi:hypothetical protein
VKHLWCRRVSDNIGLEVKALRFRIDYDLVCFLPVQDHFGVPTLAIDNKTIAPCATDM